jgi:hypothetical protein
MELKSQLSFAANVNRQYDDKFADTGAKIGSVINIRKPVRFAVTTGQTLNIQDVADQYSALTLDTQQHVGFQFSSKDLTLSIDEFRDRYIKPAITALANKIDSTGAALYYNVPSSVGTPGTAPTDLSTVLSAGQKLDENGAPVDELRALVLHPAAQTNTLKNGLTLFNDQAELAKQYKRGRMGRAMGFNFSMDQNLPSHTTGAVDGTPLVNSTTAADGDTTIAFDGTTTATITGAYKKGDVITFDSVYAVNPQSKVSTGSLKQFVVTADCNVSGNAGTLHFSPALQSTGAYQNIDSLPANNAPIKLFGAATTYASKTSQVSMAMHRDAFVLGMADLALPGGIDMASRASDPDAGLSVRIVRQYDINTDFYPCRIDVLYGWQCVYPELACRFQL